MTWTIARWENQGDAAFVGVLDIHVGNARIERTTLHDVDISVLAMSTYICIESLSIIESLCVIVFIFMVI